MTALTTTLQRSPVPAPGPAAEPLASPAPAGPLGPTAPRQVRPTTHAGAFTVQALLGTPVGPPSALDLDPRLLLVTRPAVPAPVPTRRTLLPPSDERREERLLRRRRLVSAASIVVGSALTTSAVTIALG